MVTSLQFIGKQISRLVKDPSKENSSDYVSSSFAKSTSLVKFTPI